MSHTVTVTRTTTSTTTSAIILNTGYLKTSPGLLKVLQVILGAVILVIYSFFLESFWFNSWVSAKPIAFFICIITTFFLVSSLLLLSCLISISTGAILAKTTFEFIYHGAAFIFIVIASSILVYDVNDDKQYRDRNTIFTICILGYVLAIVYIISAVLAHKSYRGI